MTTKNNKTVFTNLRTYMEGTNRRLLVGFFVILFLIGNGLIFYFYGGNAALFGLLCLGGSIVPILIIIGFFYILEKIVRSNE